MNTAVFLASDTIWSIRSCLLAIMRAAVSNASLAVVCAAILLALATTMALPTSTEPSTASIESGSNSSNITTARECTGGVVNGTSEFCFNLNVTQDTLKCVGVLGGCVLAGWVAFAIMLPCLLLALGFGVIGITAGSLAAIFQANCGTPCCFRCAQSTAMLNTPCCPRIIFGFFGAILAGVLAYYYLPLPFCFPEPIEESLLPSCFCMGHQGWRPTMSVGPPSDEIS